MKSLLFILVLCGIAAYVFMQSSCTKTDNRPDSEKIQEYIAAKGWNAQSTPEGLYYVIDSLGIGTAYPTINSTVSVKYKGYLLDGTVFDSNQVGISFGLRQVIQGWQIGIPKFKKTGRGKLLVPSSLGYGSRAVGSIPANSVLVFEIELLDF
jgi:FKBP-type peptidyl-prolyl cis-trans isomerase FkpA